ncbi:multidrug DMT transporter permease, partial [Curtobacterium sp. MCPF17_051]
MSASALAGLMIPVALISAVFLSLGAQFQSRGVQRVEARLGRQSKGLSVRHVVGLVSSGYWVLGTLMLGIAVVLQLVSITFAPLIVVQPLGAVALV